MFRHLSYIILRGELRSGRVGKIQSYANIHKLSVFNFFGSAELILGVILSRLVSYMKGENDGNDKCSEAAYIEGEFSQICLQIFAGRG